MFSEERTYDSQLLLYLGVPIEVVREYEDYQLKMDARNSHTDRVLNIFIPEDNNAPFVSIVGYKTMWIYDHFRFYFKVVTKKG